jgi:hypothetical protein
VSDFDWLQGIASADDCSTAEAAAILVENGVTLTAEDWRTLDTSSRAALTVAKRMAKATALAEQGRDIDAARAYAQIDGGVTAARLMAEAAGRGVAQALREAK